MKYNFDAKIDRSGTNAMMVEGYMEYLFDKEDQVSLPCAEEDIITMWVADMEFATCPAIADAISQRLQHPIFGYTQVFDNSYRIAFNQWCESRYGFSFKEEHIVNSLGVIPALYNLIDYHCKPDDKILIVTPSYAFFKHAADHNKRELVTSDLIYTDGSYSIDFADIEAKTADKQLSLCIFCNPHNPTGRAWTEDELRTFGEICFSNGVMIISDEIHCDLMRSGKKFTPLQKLFPDSDQIVTCMAPSKTFNLAGIMFANVIIPNDHLRSIWKEKDLGIHNPLSIAAAQAAYTHGHEWLSQLSDYLDQNFQYLDQFLKEHLPKAEFSIPDSTYLAWINLSNYFPIETNLTVHFANTTGVLLEGGNMFVDNADGWIRLNLACPMSRLIEGLERIRKGVVQ